MSEKEEPWKELCRQAAVEQDPSKLHALIIELNRILEEKENQPKAERPPKA
jgi:hypothetical protein